MTQSDAEKHCRPNYDTTEIHAAKVRFSCCFKKPYQKDTHHCNQTRHQGSVHVFHRFNYPLKTGRKGIPKTFSGQSLKIGI
jgi:hypothetical protein